MTYHYDGEYRQAQKDEKNSATTEKDYKALQAKYKALLNASKDGRQIMLINEYKKTISELRGRTAKAEAHVQALKKSVELWKGKYKKLRTRILSTTKGI